MSLHRMSACVALACVAALAGCKDPAADKPKAVVGAEVPRPTEPSRPASPGAEMAYAVTDESKIGFVGSKITGSHDGGFESFDGTITLFDGDVTRSRVEVVIDATSLWADNEKLTEHLKSPDFFEVETYPQARFESTLIVRDGEQYRISGNLTLHGITRSVTFPATIEVVEGERIRAQAEFAIKRFDWSLMYKGKADDLIRDDVVIKLDLVATPEGSAAAGAGAGSDLSPSAG